MAEILLGQAVSPIESKLRVRLAHIAPAPLRAKDYEKRFNLKICSTLYGMSEAMLMPPDPDREPVAGIIGVDPSDWDLAVVDPLGRTLGVDEPGELIARPRRPFIIFDGYLDMPAETVKAWRGLWYHTGDVARRDADGVYWFMGRSRDVIRRRGHNVSTWEMEIIVNGHPDIAEAGAVAIPTESGEEEVALYARRVDNGTITPDIVRAYCEKVLPRFMWPDHIIVQDDELPKNQAGKIDKPRLKAAFSPARPARASGG
jgi:crotonobetaine/carnitine-CoA ligase